MLSSEKDMHKRKFSISMAAILNFFISFEGESGYKSLLPNKRHEITSNCLVVKICYKRQLQFIHKYYTTH